MMSIQERYEKVRSEIPKDVSLIAVSKKQSIEAIQDLYNLGHRDFGENYVQELDEKAKRLKEACPEIRWHFIGHLQSKKVKNLIPLVQSIHSVDSEKLSLEISKRAEVEKKEISIFLQINIDDEESKSGILAQDARPLLEKVTTLPFVSVEGLMCIPRASEGESAFERMKTLSQELGGLTRGKLSMGMSSDYLTAIQKGATHVRVGTSLFGARST